MCSMASPALDTRALMCLTGRLSKKMQADIQARVRRAELSLISAIESEQPLLPPTLLTMEGASPSLVALALAAEGEGDNEDDGDDPGPTPPKPPPPPPPPPPRPPAAAMMVAA